VVRFRQVSGTSWASSSGALAPGTLPAMAVGLGVAHPEVSLAREAGQERGVARQLYSSGGGSFWCSRVKGGSFYRSELRHAVQGLKANSIPTQSICQRISFGFAKGENRFVTI
jgi:hypothetical protein